MCSGRGSELSVVRAGAGCVLRELVVCGISRESGIVRENAVCLAADAARFLRRRCFACRRCVREWRPRGAP